MKTKEIIHDVDQMQKGVWAEDKQAKSTVKVHSRSSAKDCLENRRMTMQKRDVNSCWQTLWLSRILNRFSTKIIACRGVTPKRQDTKQEIDHSDDALTLTTRVGVQEESME